MVERIIKARRNAEMKKHRKDEMGEPRGWIKG